MEHCLEGKSTFNEYYISFESLLLKLDFTMHTILGRRLVGYDQVLYQFLVSTSPIGVSDWGFHLCDSKEAFCIS